MIKDRKELESHIENLILKIVLDNNACHNVSIYLNKKYNFPKTMGMDYLTMRISLSEASEFILFCLLDALEKEKDIKVSKINNYFTEKEISAFENAGLENNKIEFPLRFRMIQVSDDQWIGSVDIKTLMQLRAAQIINYNVNAQRTLQRIIKGNKEAYKITINKAAVASIMDLYKKNVYIPTPFTLNIPFESNYDFYFDQENHELVIKSLDHFDITDGYHRYIAACRLNDIDPDFNYNMELRIVNFSEEKAKQFIYQEDQKTKMNKVDSDALNINKASNIVVARLNSSQQCNMQGLIERNGGIINFGDLSTLVDYLYFKGIAKSNEKAVIISTVKELTNSFNMITEYNQKYLNERYSFKQLSAVIYTFYYLRETPDKICGIIDEVVKRTEELNPIKFYTRTPRKSAMNDVINIIDDLLKEA